MLSRGYDLAFAQPRLPCEDEFGEMDEATCNVFYDPAMNEWLRFRGLDRAPPFGFLNLGMLAYLGGGEALSQVQIGEFPVLAWAGSVAFVLWRSVYLVKQVATRNRMLVTFDWIKSVLFGRDMTRL
uniref:External alternative NADH-ubiquinone oxidoreductase-like C-terminal domain-containing protein n=1 Tax=Pseudictyota dubia TaxID=2749911 RepID=A0A7R9W8S1_9STRA